MSSHVEISDLFRGTGSRAGNVRTAESIRAALIGKDSEEPATTNMEGHQVTITANGSALTVSQVLAELDVLSTGE